MGKSKLDYFNTDTHDVDGIMHKLLNTSFWPRELRSSTRYVRLHDDHDGTFQGRIAVVFSEDGDAWVEISDRNVVTEGLRFRTPMIGGGISPRTRNAMLILAEAIRLDNAERPITIPPICQYCHSAAPQDEIITVEGRPAHRDCARDAVMMSSDQSHTDSADGMPNHVVRMSVEELIGESSKSKVRHSYEPETDMLTVEGIKYSGELFRFMAKLGVHTDQWIKLNKSADGAITMTTMDLSK